MEDLLLDQLAAAGYHVNDSSTPRDLQSVVPVAIQCFKNSSLKYLASRTNIPLVQLMGISNEQPDKTAVFTEAVLDEVMGYAQAVAPDKAVFTEDWGASVQDSVRMRKWASDRDLLFTPWSFQQEQQYIPAQFGGSAKMEMLYYYACLQSTAIFHEFPDMAREVADICRREMEIAGTSHCLKLCPYL
jgi:glycerophosphoryl diester phosphodiesterase